MISYKIKFRKLADLGIKAPGLHYMSSSPKAGNGLAQH